MKLSIIMPSYNDSETIEESLDSLMDQTLTDWELILVDDGSKDNTRQIIQKYKEEKDKQNRIKYFYQENADQLNAILNGIQYATGEYFFVFHSDDLINEKDSLEKCVNYLDKHKNVDSIIADLVTIDENSNITGVQKVYKYKYKEYIKPLQLLWLGRNLYIDVSVHRRETYLNKVKNNYVIWNTPFWINFKGKESVEILNVEKVDFIFMKYRIHSGNYMNSYKGMLNVINGELRTLVSLMKFYNIPFYKLQYIFFRAFNKLKLYPIYRPLYQKREQKNKGQVVEFVVKKRFGDKYVENRFLKVLVDFYKKNSTRQIEITEFINPEIVYQGKDNAKFNNALLENKLDDIYIKIMDEMEQGFNTVIVKNDEEKKKIEDILRFLCIYPFANVIVK